MPSLTPLDVLHKGISTVDFGQMTLDEDNDGDDGKDRFSNFKIQTKFPPPPYLPGEVERRAALLCTDTEFLKKQSDLEYKKSLFYYL